MSASAEAAGIGRNTVYDQRQRDPSFRRRMDEALESALDDLEASAFQKAKDGWVEPVFYKGEIVGAVKRFAPQLMQFFLERRRRDVYGARAESSLGSADAAAAVRDALAAMDAVEEGNDE